jgi:hypothetical protein
VRSLKVNKFFNIWRCINAFYASLKPALHKNALKRRIIKS